MDFCLNELSTSVETMQCCSCGKCEISNQRLAALRQSAASCGGCRDASQLDDGSPVSAFAVYCRCTKHRRIPNLFSSPISSATASDLMSVGWRYWSLAFHRQFFQDLERSTWMNYRYICRQQQRRQRQQLLIRKPTRPVFGKPAGFSATSARQFSCPSCSYSTDRKNNLKRHVTTMHRRPDSTAVTSSGGNHDDGDTRKKMSSNIKVRSPCASTVGVVWSPHTRNDMKMFLSP